MPSPKKEKKNKAVDKRMIQCIIFLHGHQTNLEVTVKNISVPGAELGGVCGFSPVLSMLLTSLTYLMGSSKKS